MRLVHGLDDGTFEHRICAVRGSDTEFVRAQQLEGRLYVVGRSDPGLEFPLFRLARVMRSYKPHIVHSRNWGAIEAIPAARLAGAPVTIHSEHGYELDMLEGLPLRRRLFRRAIYPMADAIFTVSSELRDYHAREAWISSDRIRVIHNGVDTERFAPRADVRAQVRKEWRLPSDSFVVGTVSRLVPIKDHLTLFKSAAILRRRGVDVRVMVVGAGPELARLQSHVAASGLADRVVFTGASDVVPSLLNALDAFTLTSIGEGMSNTLLEAMASALPLVATCVGGNPELVKEGCTGWLISPGDSEHLADCLERLAVDVELRRRVGEGARRRASEEFGLGQMLRRYRELYLELAGRRRLLDRS